MTAVARFVGVPVRQAMVIFFSSNGYRFFAQRSIRFRRVAHTDALNFSDFDSLLLRASALVMTGDKVWYLLLKAKQDVRFSFLRITAMSAKRHLQVGKNSMLASHCLSDLHGLRSRRRKLRFAWFKVWREAQFLHCTMPLEQRLWNTCTCQAKAMKMEISQKPTRKLTRARPLHETKSNVWC